MSFRKTIKNKFGVNLPIKGGDGTSIEDPIIIDKTQNYSYVGLEKICINYACLLIGMEWIMEKQELIEHEGIYIDVLKIKLSHQDNFEHNYIHTIFYFDISDCINYTLNRAEFNKVW